MLSHTTLAMYYENTFALAQHHNYSISDIETLVPFEKYIYVDMLVAFIQKQKEEVERLNGR